jgi:hypothetical protein
MSSTPSGHTSLVGSHSLGKSSSPDSSGLEESSVPLGSHELLSILLEFRKLLGLDTVIHGGDTSTLASRDSLVRVVREGLGLGTSMGSSSGEADESLSAVMGVITISLAETELVLGGPSLVLETRSSRDCNSSC